MAAEISLARSVLVMVRWLLGMGLVSWRYLWQITPLHRSEELGDATDLPAAVPEDLLDEQCQLVDDGVGPLFHRRFSVRIEGHESDGPRLMAALTHDLNRAAPTEVATFDRTCGRRGGVRVGDEFVVRMPGPWNGPVRVISRDPASFRLATLRGHLEAGQIEFRIRPEDDALRFEIETWARPSTRLVHVLYTRLRLAKEMQLNMWTRFCLQVATLAGGRARGGVHIRTRYCTDRAS